MLEIILTIANTLVINCVTLFKPNSISHRHFYNQLKHLINCTQEPLQYFSIHILTIFGLIAFIIRFLLILFAIRNFDSFQFMNYDLFYHFFCSFSNQNDYFFVVIFILLFFYVILSEIELYLRQVNTITWKKYEDIVIQNVDVFTSFPRKFHNQNEKSETEFKHFIKKLSNTGLPDSSRLFTHFPNLTFGTRLKLYKFITSIELLNKGLFTSLAIPQIGWSFLYYTLMLQNNFSLYFIPLYAIDYAAIHYLIIRLIVVVLLMLWGSVTSSLMYGLHFTYLNKILSSLSRQPKPISWINLAKLRFIREEHCKISALILTVNAILWGRLLLVTLFINVPINGYLLYRIVFYPGHFQFLLSSFILVAQLLAMLGAFIPLAWSCKIIHGSTAFLNAMQLRLGKARWRQKWKLTVLYERVHSNRKYGITIGPTNAITYSAIFEIALLYMALTLKVFEFFMF